VTSESKGCPHPPSWGGQFHFGESRLLRLGKRRLEIGIVTVNHGFQARNRNMDIAVLKPAIEFNKQAVHLVVGASQHLRNIAKFLAIGTDDVRRGKLRSTPSLAA
jgi:hypothetical protein